MYTITIESSFKASHQLTYANGEKEDLHEHDWQLRIAVEVEELDENGLAIDFIDLKSNVDKITAILENTNLEELPCFERINASAENVARYIYDQTKGQLPTKAMLNFVEVMEAEGCWAKYSDCQQI